MRVLFLGDVVGDPGRKAVKSAVPGLIEEFGPDFIVVNGENAAGGNGITPKLAYDLFRAKVDVITLGDHVWDQRDVTGFFDEEPRLIRPFNYPAACPGKGYVVVNGNGLKLGVINGMGRTFMNQPVDNPFNGVDEILKKVKAEAHCVLVDFHAETTSEKIAFGWHLDGRVSAVVGTHTHVQTADEKILPNGTAYITDAGFCGPHDSILGRDKWAIVERFKSCMPQRMRVASQDVRINGVLIEIDEETARATRIERLNRSVNLE